MNSEIETAATMTRWSCFVDHVKNNRIEYLLAMGLLHIVGATARLQEKVSGVCF